MKKTAQKSALKLKGRLHFGITLALNVLLIAAVFLLMNFVQQLLHSDVRINLTEIVTQNKDVIASKLMLEMNNLDLAAKQLDERFAQAGADDYESMRAVFLAYGAEKGDPTLTWSYSDGRALFPSGQEVVIAGRKYFRLAMEGNANISERTVSRVTGEDIFVMSVPIAHSGRIIGTVQKQYSPAEMYQLCAVSLFSEQGYMYVINSDGYILINSQNAAYNREADNYYRMLYLTDPEGAVRIEADIRTGQSGFIDTELNGQKIFSAYTPIDQVYDWYLVSSVATGAVSPNATLVVQLFYGILLGVVLFFACLMFYFLSLKNRERTRLEQAVFVDKVTRGNTYAKFELELRAILAHAPDREFYFFTFDIDNFKYINAYYGFDAGDRLLRYIYQLYEAKLSQNEQIARVNGDRFVLLLSDASPERLDTFFEPECRMDGITAQLSAGLYPIADHEESVALMMDKAATAAKSIKGMRYKQIVTYSAENDRENARGEEIKRAVEQALVDGEIIPFFQPKVDVNTRALVGAEALARWRNKDGALVSPAAFIPICEKSGLIVAVDMAIFEQTLRFLRKNLDHGVACVPISVNFSRMHLMNHDFMETVLQKLAQYQVPPRLVELELTESVIFDNYQTIEDFINTLHQNGLQISMDDFGTGYSSLHMLKDVDIDVLKIDQSFLRETSDSSRQRAIFGAIIQMAHSLNIKVVVEGVETEENVALMKEFDCAIAQGYLFARPMDGDSFQKICEKGVVE